MLNVFSNKGLGSIIAPLQKIYEELEQFVEKSKEDVIKSKAEIFELDKHIKATEAESAQAVSISGNIKNILGVR